MRSTPVEHLLDDRGESIPDEDDMEKDISEIEDDIKNSKADVDVVDVDVHVDVGSGLGIDLQTEGISHEIDTMRNELKRLKQETRTTRPEYRQNEGNIFDAILKYRKIDDFIEIVSLLSVYILFTLNTLNEVTDNLIPYMFYQYSPLIKGLVFVIAFRFIRFSLQKLLKKE